MTDISQAPNFTFDASQFAPDQGQPVIPADKYQVVISNTELKATKDGKGAYFDVSYQVLEGPYAGAILHDRFNIMNDNQQTVRIAYGQLSALCHAVNVHQITMSNHGANLRGARLMVDVTIRNGEQGPQNDVKRRYDSMGNEPGKQGQRPMAAPGPIPGQPGGFAGGPGPAPGAPPATGWGAPPQGPAPGGPAPGWGAPPPAGPGPGWPAQQPAAMPPAAMPPAGPAPGGWPQQQPAMPPQGQPPAPGAPSWGQGGPPAPAAAPQQPGPAPAWPGQQQPQPGQPPAWGR